MQPIDISILMHFNLKYFDDNLISADVTDNSLDLLLSPTADKNNNHNSIKCQEVRGCSERKIQNITNCCTSS